MQLSWAHNLIGHGFTHNPDFGFAALVIGFLGVAFWMAGLQSCLSNEPPTDGTRTTWIWIIVLLGPLGSFVYLVYRRPQRIRDVGW